MNGTNFENVQLSAESHAVITRLIESPSRLDETIRWSEAAHRKLVNHQKLKAPCPDGLAEAIKQLRLLRSILDGSVPIDAVTGEAERTIRDRAAALAERREGETIRQVRIWLHGVRLKTLTDPEYHATESDLNELEAILR